MNRQWMRERLESFKALCEKYQDEGRRTADYTDTMRAISDQMAYEMPTVRAIHPHVWQAASALWGTGQYRVAVGQATVSLSADSRVTDRTGSRLS